MTGMEHAIEQAAKVIAAALHDKADVDLFGGYTDTDDLNDSVLDSRYSLIAVARALAEAGLIAPAPLTEIRAENQFGETHRRWATDWIPVDRAEGDGSAET
ncbi:hypothetical protein ACWIDS_16300 [Dietzia maris]